MPCNRGHDPSEWIPERKVCRVCIQENSAKSYQRNREKRRKATKERRERYSEGFPAKTKPCRRCGGMNKSPEGRCKDCAKKRKEKWRQTTAGRISQEKERANRKKRVKDLTEWAKSLKDKPCTDCGESFKTHELHWDHLPGTVKISNVSDMVSRLASKEEILTEIAKCELVCERCHARRGVERGQLNGNNQHSKDFIERNSSD